MWTEKTDRVVILVQHFSFSLVCNQKQRIYKKRVEQTAVAIKSSLGLPPIADYLGSLEFETFCPCVQSYFSSGINFSFSFYIILS